MQTVRQLSLVFAGGALGALLRVVLLALPFAEEAHRSLLLLSGINISGSFFLGLLLGMLGTRASSEKAGLLLGTGLLGGFTSYSALMFPALAGVDSLPIGVAFGLVNIVIAVGAAWLGAGVARRMRGRGVSAA